MKEEIFKEMIANSALSMADEKNIHPRLVRLATLLEEITEKLVDCTFAAYAQGCVETAITLEHINFDVMRSVVKALEKVDSCNALLTSNESPCDSQIKEAVEIAKDIYADLPIGYGVSPTAPSEDELNAITARFTTFEGYVHNLNRMVTAKGELMAKFDFECSDGSKVVIVAFPKTFQHYGDSLEWLSTRHFQVAIRVENYSPYILSAMQSNFASLLATAEKESHLPLDKAVRITQDLLDETMPLFKGDTGKLEFFRQNKIWGFRSERWGTLSFTRNVNGQNRSILDFLELIEENNEDTRPLPELSEEDWND